MKTIHIILILVVVGAIALVVGNTLSSSKTYSNFATAASKPGEEFYIIGELDRSKPLEYDALKNANRFSFYMIDEKGLEKKVIYNNAKPQDFEKSEKTVIFGSMKGEEFIAKRLLLKCPSKYNDQKSPTKFQEKTYEAK